MKWEAKHGEDAFETRDFYLACFLRCTGYELLDLRAEGRRKVFVFGSRYKAERRDGLLWRRRRRSALRIFLHDQGHEGAAAQCLMSRRTMMPRSPAGRKSARRLTGSASSPRRAPSRSLPVRYFERDRQEQQA